MAAIDPVWLQQRIQQQRRYRELATTPERREYHRGAIEALSHVQTVLLDRVEAEPVDESQVPTEASGALESKGVE